MATAQENTALTPRHRGFIRNELFGMPLTSKIGVTIVVTNAFVAIFAPLIAPYGETELVSSTFWSSPSGDFLLGTDNLGRDILSRIIYGARTTIGIALVASLIGFAMGIVAGFTAALLGGLVDQLLGRLVDALMAIPSLILALVVISVLGTDIVILIMVIATLESTRVFRLSRAIAMDVAVMEFVEAARLRGEGVLSIMRREILPNTAMPLIAEFGLRFSFAILLISSLSFLGLGVQPPFADWGSMVKDNASGITYGIPAPLYPAAAIGLLTIGVNLVVDFVLARQALTSVGAFEDSDR